MIWGMCPICDREIDVKGVNDLAFIRDDTGATVVCLKCFSDALGAGKIDGDGYVPSAKSGHSANGSHPVESLPKD